MENSYHQHELRLIGEVRRPDSAPMAHIDLLPSFRAALSYAITHSGLDQSEIARSLGIDPGDFSRMVRVGRREGSRLREFPTERLAHFCRITNSKAPVQWLAAHVGDELIPYRPETTEQKLARLEVENARLRLSQAA